MWADEHRITLDFIHEFIPGFQMQCAADLDRQRGLTFVGDGGVRHKKSLPRERILTFSKGKESGCLCQNFPSV
jgi:hypothetical protein